MLETKTCKECEGKGFINIEFDTHVDVTPCSHCALPAKSCRNGHIGIQFYGWSCPLCAANEKLEALQTELNIVADTEHIAKRIRTALEGGL